MWDKPLDTIKTYIQGYWKLEYRRGGIAGDNYIDHPTKLNSYSFNQNVVLWTVDGNTFANNNIGWVNTSNYNYHIQANTVWTMSFNDTRSIPYNFIINKIKNDTLVFDENFLDGQSCYCSRVK